MKKERIFSCNEFDVFTTGRDYDFIWAIINKSEGNLTIQFSNESGLDDINIAKDDWVGIFNHDANIISEIKNKAFDVQVESKLLKFEDKDELYENWCR